MAEIEMKKVFVDSLNVKGFVFIENLEKYIEKKKFRYAKSIYDVKRLLDVIDAVSKLIFSLYEIGDPTTHVEVIVTCMENGEPGPIFVKPTEVDGLYVALAPAVPEQDEEEYEEEEVDQ